MSCTWSQYESHCLASTSVCHGTSPFCKRGSAGHIGSDYCYISFKKIIKCLRITISFTYRTQCCKQSWFKLLHCCSYAYFACLPSKTSTGLIKSLKPTKLQRKAWSCTAHSLLHCDWQNFLTSLMLDSSISYNWQGIFEVWNLVKAEVGSNTATALAFPLCVLMPRESIKPK